jgi:hypothetical protein
MMMQGTQDEYKRKGIQGTSDVEVMKALMDEMGMESRPLAMISSRVYRFEFHKVRPRRLSHVFNTCENKRRNAHAVDQYHYIDKPEKRVQ